MKMKIILLTLISGTAALLLAQQTQYQGAAPGNPNAPNLPPNNVIRTQSVSPQEISPQNISPTQNISTQQISPQNFSTNQWNNSKTNWSGQRQHEKEGKNEDTNVQQPPKSINTHFIVSVQ